MAAAHEPPDAFVLQSPEHFKALGHPVRHRLVNVLRQRPATLRQLTEALSLAKGTVAYHVGVLQQADMVQVVETRRVRGGTEQYLGLVSEAFTFHDGTLGAEFLYRSARAETLPERPDGAEQTSLKHLWLTPDQARELWAALSRAATTPEGEAEAVELVEAGTESEAGVEAEVEVGGEVDGGESERGGASVHMGVAGDAGGRKGIGGGGRREQIGGLGLSGEGAAVGRAGEQARSEAYGLLISLYRADIPLLPPDEPSARADALPESPHAS